MATTFAVARGQRQWRRLTCQKRLIAHLYCRTARLIAYAQLLGLVLGMSQANILFARVNTTASDAFIGPPFVAMLMARAR